jgi:hypothetical protein
MNARPFTVLRRTGDQSAGTNFSSGAESLETLTPRESTF